MLDTTFDWIDYFIYLLLFLVIGGAMIMAFLGTRRERREKKALKTVAMAMGFSHGSNKVMGDEIKGEYRGREVRAWWRVAWSPKYSAGSGRKDTLVIEVALAYEIWSGVRLGGKSRGVYVPLASLHYKPPDLMGCPIVELESERFNNLCVLRKEVSTAQREVLQSEGVLSTLQEIRKVSPKFQIVDDVIAVEIDSPAAESGDVIHSSTSDSTAIMLQDTIETMVDLAIRLDDVEQRAACLKSEDGLAASHASSGIAAEVSEVEANEENGQHLW